MFNSLKAKDTCSKVQKSSLIALGEFIPPEEKNGTCVPYYVDPVIIQSISILFLLRYRYGHLAYDIYSNT